MSRGFYNHVWYKLLDEDGVPIPSASVWLYNYKYPTVQIKAFDENEDLITQPIMTNSNGVLDFYVKDIVKSSIDGYMWDTQYIISWSKDTKSGIIRGDHLFGDFRTAITSGSSTKFTKTISDYYGWIINSHVDFMFGTTLRCGSSSSSSSSISSSSSSSSTSSS